jgi:uncharacterized membrane protein YkoI
MGGSAAAPARRRSMLHETQARPMLTRTLMHLLLAAAVSACALPAQADGRRDHDRARAALEAGQILPLATVLERVRSSHPGEVLEVELEHEDGLWVYELKLLRRGGALLRLHVDARSGAVVKRREGRR